ncbi:hypothetical protein [Dokdonella soli]|uniref:Blue (type 1) copper domain-containing protein n=1 Tax=Dokdonella soli TaxID=529810 RepID=A0ABN1IDH0_9GAMM
MPTHQSHAARTMPKALLALCLLGSNAAVHAVAPVVSLNVANSGTGAWLINGQSNPSLVLLRGSTYEFVMQNVSSIHTFNINTIDTTGFGSQYSNGVTNNAATGTTTLTFVVPADAPDSLHYNCSNHTAMNGPITVVTDLIFANGFD